MFVLRGTSIGHDKDMVGFFQILSCFW